MRILSPYQQIMSEATKITHPAALREIEETVRHCVLSPTLDGYTREAIAEAALTAVDVLSEAGEWEAEWDEYEDVENCIQPCEEDS